MRKPAILFARLTRLILIRDEISNAILIAYISAQESKFFI